MPDLQIVQMSSGSYERLLYRIFFRIPYRCTASHLKLAKYVHNWQ